VVETLLARISTDRTPFAGGPTKTRNDQALLPSSPTLSATPAAARPSKAEGDVLEIPFVAALLVVNDKVSVLQTDFVEVLSVKAGQAQAVEPIKAGKQSACVLSGPAAAAGEDGETAPDGAPGIWRGNVAAMPASFL